MVIKVGINGFGRIGRIILRTCLQNPDIVVSAINDPAIDVEYICYLIKFDSTHGKFQGVVLNNGDDVKIDDQVMKIFHEKLPSIIPWQTAGVQYVVEASGMFTTLEKASGHLASEGVKRVLVTAPSVDIPMIILGVNEDKLKAEHKIMSCTSSTLYCLAPITKILDDHFGVADGFITSIHAMTPSLKPLDGLCLRGKHWRDHRSIHQNIIPSNTGACKALGKIIPKVKDKMTGLAFRVPIVNVSVLDITIRLNMNTSLQEIISNVQKACKTRMRNIVKISYDEAVSSDFIGDTHSCIVDAKSCLQLKSNFFKIICWYENEYSYACRIIDSILFSENQFKYKINCIRPHQLSSREVILQKQCVGRDRSPEVSKLLRGISGFKNKLKRATVVGKHVSSNSGNVQSPKNTERNSDDIFKIWYDSEQESIGTRQNGSAFFQNYVYKNTDKKQCTKAQETLDNVKKEFTKMVNITEDLFKTHSKKMDLSSQRSILKDNNVKKETKNIEVNTNNTEKTSVEKCFKTTENIYITNSPFVDKNVEELFPSSRFNYLNNSDYSSIKMNRSNSVINIIDTDSESISLKQSDVNNRVNSGKQTDTIEEKDNLLKFVNKNKVIIFIEKAASASDTVLNKMSPISKIPYVNLKNKVSEEFVSAHKLSNNMTYVKKKISTECLWVHFDVSTSTYNIPKKDNRICDDKKIVFNDYLARKCSKEQVSDIMEKKSLYIEDLQKGNIVSDTHTNNIQGDNSPIIISANHDDFAIKMDVKADKTELNDKQNEFSTDVVNIEAKTTCNTKFNKSSQDIYDKLDSASATDSNNSLKINERKSQVINILDLTNSLDDLPRLDKICRIIEISDELSDQLFSPLDNGDKSKCKKWSFKDLCERIKLDEFCNKVFEKSVRRN